MKPEPKRTTLKVVGIEDSVARRIKSIAAAAGLTLAELLTKTFSGLDGGKPKTGRAAA